MLPNSFHVLPCLDTGLPAAQLLLIAIVVLGNRATSNKSGCRLLRTVAYSGRREVFACVEYTDLLFA